MESHWYQKNRSALLPDHLHFSLFTNVFLQNWQWRSNTLLATFQCPNLSSAVMNVADLLEILLRVDSYFMQKTF